MENIQDTSFTMPWMNCTPEDSSSETFEETPPNIGQIDGGGDRIVNATARLEIATRVRYKTFIYLRERLKIGKGSES